MNSRANGGGGMFEWGGVDCGCRHWCGEGEGKGKGARGGEGRRGLIPVLCLWELSVNRRREDHSGIGRIYLALDAQEEVCR